MIRNYVESASLAVRRQIEVKGRDKPLSIGRIIQELLNYPQLVSFQYFAGLYPNRPTDQWMAKNDYSRFADESGLRLDLAKLQSDLDSLKSSCKIVLHYTDRRIAHYDERGLKMRVPSFRDLDSAIDLIEVLTQKYNLLIKAEDTELLPVIQYDWLKVLRIPWINKEMRF
jgi:hypothetical protein